MAGLEQRVRSIEDKCTSRLKDLAENTASIKALREDLASYGEDIRNIRKWVLGNGGKGLLEQVRTLSAQVSRIEAALQVAKENDAKIRAAAVSGRLGLAGVIVLAAVQLVVHFVGG